MKVLVLLNPKSGSLATSPTGDEPRRIVDGFAAHGVTADVRCLEGGAIRPAAEAAKSNGTAPDRVMKRAPFAAVVAGGGDGTLNAVAAALAGGATPFGVLPLGTHNHFAKELGVPLELDRAVGALAEALKADRTADLDVAEVNGRIFLNFSGVGLHPQVVRQRDREHAALGRFHLLRKLLRKVLKLFALVIALMKALPHPPVRRVWITAGGRTFRRLTPSVIVCNNAHQMEVFGVADMARVAAKANADIGADIANHTAPDRCVLNVFVARATGPAGLARLLIASLLRRLDRERQFEVLCLPALTVATRRRRLAVSIDGEVVEMRSPLQYSVRRGGLKVIATANSRTKGGHCPPPPSASETTKAAGSARPTID